MISNYSINYLVKRELSELSEVGYKTKETAKKQMTKNARKNTNNAKKKKLPTANRRYYHSL